VVVTPRKSTFLVVISPKTSLEKKTTRRKFSSGPLEKPYTALSSPVLSQPPSTRCHELKLIHHMQTSRPHFQSAGSRRRSSCHRDKTCSILDAVDSSSSDKDYIIDAVMEEKTAGLASATTTTNVGDDDNDDDDDDNVTNTSSWWPRTMYNNNRDIFKNA